MKKHRQIWIVIVAICLLTMSGWSAEPAATQQAQAPVEQVFQVSTLQALLEGCYDGILSAGELRKHGNYGIGTFQGLDGEMVVANGEVWQVRADGAIVRVPDATLVPFSNVSVGALPSLAMRSKLVYPSVQTTLPAFVDLVTLQKQIEEKITNRNLPYLIIMEGEFLQVQTRSVPGQQKPYPRLIEVVKQQAVFRTEKVRGILVGFWFPEYFKGINMPGFHLHFLSDDRKAGGHLLDIAAAEGVKLAVFPKANFQMRLPTTGEFAGKDIARDRASELHTIEGK